MKHRVREAIFNLISTESAGRHVIDLFAGTGALGLEALEPRRSERHVHRTARPLGPGRGTRTSPHLDVADRVTVRITSAFLWSKRDLPSASPTAPPAELPWLVFCSPPYAFFVERVDEMLELIQRIGEHAPPASTLVIESDQRFDFQRLIGDNNSAWDVREYPPAVVGIWRPDEAVNQSAFDSYMFHAKAQAQSYV